MDDDGSPYLGLVALLFLVAAYAILYGFLTALENQNESGLEKLEKEGNKRAGVLLRLADKPSGSIHMAQFLLTGLTLFAGTYIIAGFSGIRRIGFLLVFWFLLLAAGIYAPAKIAAKKAQGWGLALCGLAHILYIVCFPFVFATEWVSDLLVRLCGVDPKEDLDDVTEEEIISMVREGHEQGVLLESEAEMIHNIFEFGDKEAKDIMTHRKNINALDGAMTFGDALEFMTENSNSRYPVYLEDIDNIIGVLHIKEALQICNRQEYYGKPIKDIRDLVRKVAFIPETRNINTLFAEMQKEKNHMVIVVDEYGQTAGLVAMEDILEEIVGNIFDEYDEDDETILKQFDGSYLISGMADFEDVAKTLDIPASEEDAYETLNGFLISQIDKIPSDDDKITVNACGYCFKVLSVENKIIQKVAVTRLPEKKNPETSDVPIGE